MSYPPGEGPITEDEAKAAVAAEEPEDEDVEPPAEPLEDVLDGEALTEEGGE